MAEFSVVRRKAKKPAADVQDLTQEDQSSLLSKAGAGAMSGLHTIGSFLSWPSRLLHGGINAAVGGKGGFGENYLNPFDSRGSVEGSRHLINAGILPENNPNEWEWSDFHRGLADFALDPTTYAGPGLTKLGLQAGKTGALAAGRVAQTANKQRALLNIGLPFMEPAISIGTGPGVAKALQNVGKYSGLTRASNAVKASFPVRAGKAWFDARHQGLMHPTAQKEAAAATDEMRKLQKQTMADTYRGIRTEDIAKMHPDDLRMGFEGAEKSAVQGGFVPHPAASTDPLEPHVMLHINPQGKIVEHFKDAADTGVLDDVITSGKPVTAPFMHLDASGNPVLGKGMVHQKKIAPLAKQAYEAELQAIRDKAANVPTWADTNPVADFLDEYLKKGAKGTPDELKFMKDNAKDIAVEMERRRVAEEAAKNAPFSITDVLKQHFPGALNSEMIDFRALSRLTGKTPAEIVEALNKEIPGGFSMHRHDFPSQIVNEGKQADFHWMPKEPGDIGSYDTPFIGFGLRRDVGEQLAGQPLKYPPVAPSMPAKVIHPERQKLLKEFKDLKKARKARLAEHAARIAAEIQGTHGGDEALATLAKLRDLKEPNMAVMVPRSQAEQIRRQFSGGERTRNVSANTETVRKLPEYEHWKKANEEMLAREQEQGFGLGQNYNDVVDYGSRHRSVTAEAQKEGISQHGSAVIAAKTAGDTSRKPFLTGNYEGTIGVNKVLKDPELHEILATSGPREAMDALTRKYGHLYNRTYQTPAMRKVAERTGRTLGKYEAAMKAVEQKIVDQRRLVDALKANPAYKKELAKASKRLKRLEGNAERYKQGFAEATAAHQEALAAGKDRFPQIIKYMKNHPELREKDLFGNHPLVDTVQARLANDRKYAMAKAAVRTIQQELNKGDNAVSLLEFAEGKGFKLRPFAENIAGQTFDTAKEMKAFLANNKIDSYLAEQLKSLTPGFKAPEAVNEVAKKFKSAMAWWKGLTLAFPASRVRDAVGGVVQNVLHGWADPRFLAKDARLLLTGKTIMRDYSHVPEIQEWLAKTGKEWSPENQTEALRQMVATHLPSEHNVLADVPTGQVGAGLAELSHNIPGTQQTTMFNQFIGDPLKTLAGRGAGGESWLGRAEPGESLLGRGVRAIKQPFTGVRGVGDQAETMFAPVKASEIVASNSDAYNRLGPFLQQVHGGTSADIAAGNVNRAQVDYCVDEQTEILTTNGWKTFDKLTVGDRALTIDMETNSISWKPVQAVNIFQKQWRMLHSWQGQGFDALTTNAHRWMGRSGRYVPVKETVGAGLIRSESSYQRAKPWRWLNSEHVHSKQCTLILGGGTYEGCDIPGSVSDEVVELCGWYVTEGSPVNKSGIAIPQSVRHNPHYVERIEKLRSHFARLGATATRWSDGDHGWGPIATFYFGSGVGEQIRYVLCPNKTLSIEFLLMLTGPQLELLYNTILDGDLERRQISKKNGRESARISQKRRDVVDTFQLLAAFLGKRTRIVDRNDGAHRMSVYSSPFLHSESLKKEMVEHCGIVWCPTIETGVWMARRNGCTYWTGNSPDTFTATERGIKNYIAPFYSFNSRMIPETARQLSNFGSPTSQLIKTVDRSHGGGDASVPDYVMSGTGVPLGTRADGSKSYLTGLGQMYEPAVSQLGLLAGGITDPRSLRAAGFDTLAQLNPMLGTPLQRITGQSFFQRGEPISNLDPIAGRTISNIGETLGLRDKEEGPVKFPGSAYLDTILGATPFGRAAGQVRTVFDPRKDALSKLVDTMSGTRVTDISPEKQMATLQKRAEDLARSQGAWEQRTVGFPKEQLARLAETNPELAAEQQHLQNMITAMKRKRTIHRKKKAAEKAADKAKK